MSYDYRYTKTNERIQTLFQRKKDKKRLGMRNDDRDQFKKILRNCQKDKM